MAEVVGHRPYACCSHSSDKFGLIGRHLDHPSKIVRNLVWKARESGVKRIRFVLSYGHLEV